MKGGMGGQNVYLACGLATPAPGCFYIACFPMMKKRRSRSGLGLKAGRNRRGYELGKTARSRRSRRRAQKRS